MHTFSFNNQKQRERELTHYRTSVSLASLLLKKIRHLCIPSVAQTNGAFPPAGAIRSMCTVRVSTAKSGRGLD